MGTPVQVSMNGTDATWESCSTQFLVLIKTTHGDKSSQRDRERNQDVSFLQV